MSDLGYCVFNFSEIYHRYDVVLFNDKLYVVDFPKDYNPSTYEISNIQAGVLGYSPDNSDYYTELSERFIPLDSNKPFS